MKRGSSVAVLLAVLTLAAALTAPIAHAGDACAATNDLHPNRTFDVRVSVPDDKYRLGEIVKFRASVTRDLQGTDLGPAEGVKVTVAVSLDGHYIWGGGVTDEDGKATISIRLKRFMPEGSADVHAWGEKMIVDLPCNSQYEYEFGSVLYTNLLHIAR